VHQLQGKTKGVKPTELIALLQECYRDRLVMFERHKAVATHVRDYDVNNAYQYVINREETHLSWLADALTQLGGSVPDNGATPSITLDRSKDAWRSLLGEDARAAAAFLEKWRPRVEALTQARDQTMLRLMLGEVQEQQRTFEQAAAGVNDLLGRKDVGSGKRGVVGSGRWIGD
jgi:septum formation inhibitor MinC